MVDWFDSKSCGLIKWDANKTTNCHIKSDKKKRDVILDHFTIPTILIN